MLSSLPISALNLSCLILYQSVFLFVVLSFFGIVIRATHTVGKRVLVFFHSGNMEQTQLSKLTTSKRVRTKLRGFQSGETEAITPFFAMTLSWRKTRTKCVPGPDSQTGAERYQNKCELVLGRLQEECLLETDMLTIDAVHSGRIYPNLSRFTFCILFPKYKSIHTL